MLLPDAGHLQLGRHLLQPTLQLGRVGPRLANECLDVVAGGKERTVVAEELVLLGGQLTQQDGLDQVAEVEGA